MADFSLPEAPTPAARPAMTSLSAMKVAAEPMAWLLVPASRSLTPLCFLFVGVKWARVIAMQGVGAVLRRGARQLWRAVLTVEIWFFVYTVLVARGLQRQRWKAPEMRGDKMKVMRKIIEVMDVVFGESSGRMRRPQSLSQLQESMQEARGCLAKDGDLLTVETLLRHWASASDTPSSGRLRLDAESPSSAASSTDGVTLPHNLLVELKRAELTAWFKGVPFDQLTRDDLAVLVAGSCYSRTPEEVRARGLGEELDALIGAMERSCDVTLPAGAATHTPMRVGMDPICWKHRPFVFYAVTELSIKAVTFLAMRGLGFEAYSSGSLRYWYRPGAGVARVFCHGVGLGVLPYMDLLRRLSHEPGPLFAIELEAIAMRIQRTVPSHSEVAANIRDMLSAWGFPSAHFIGHSFGTVVMAWVARLNPALICRASFLDPVVFLLCNPQMCFKFMYKQPREGIEKLMHFFVTSELYMANMMSRHFTWHECLLWEEDLNFPDGSLLVLSGEDQLVPSHEVRRYMAKRAPPGTAVVFLDHFFHGEFLMRPKVLGSLVERLK